MHRPKRVFLFQWFRQGYWWRVCSPTRHEQFWSKWRSSKRCIPRLPDGKPPIRRWLFLSALARFASGAIIPPLTVIRRPKSLQIVRSVFLTAKAQVYFNSVPTLIFRIPHSMLLRIISSGIPEPPWRTRGIFTASTSSFNKENWMFGISLYIPWAVPIEGANESAFVASTNFLASLILV